MTLLPIAAMDETVLKKEFRTLKKLCVGNKHKNIVEIFEYRRHVNNLNYIIDMEVCRLNLHDYMYSSAKTPPILQQCSPYYENNRNVDKVESIVDVMLQITSGVAFIHKLKEVHRNLKPSNGIYAV